VGSSESDRPNDRLYNIFFALMIVTIICSVAAVAFMMGRDSRPAAQGYEVAERTARLDGLALDSFAAKAATRAERSSAAVEGHSETEVQAAAEEAVADESEVLRQQLRAKLLRELTPVMANSTKNEVPSLSLGAPGDHAAELQRESREETDGVFETRAEPRTVQASKKVRTIVNRLVDQPAVTVNFLSSASDARNVVVFTDWTCPYCRRLHEAMDEINAAGINVRYAFFPRALALGEGDSQAQAVVAQMRNILCQDDPASALTDRFQGKDIPAVGCTKEEGARKVSQIEQFYALGHFTQIRSTPFILTETGHSFAGFSGASDFIKKINASAAVAQDSLPSVVGGDGAAQMGPEQTPGPGR